MPVPAASYDEIRSFLYADPVRNATLIGGIEKTLPWMHDVWVARDPSSEVRGVLAFSTPLPGAAGGIRTVVLAGDRAAAEECFDWLPAGEEFQFQLSDLDHVWPLAQRFQCR